MQDHFQQELLRLQITHTRNHPLTIHIVFGNLKDFTQVAEHLVQKLACVFIGVWTERITANSLQHTQRRVGEQTHNTTSSGMDLNV